MSCDRCGGAKSACRGRFSAVEWSALQVVRHSQLYGLLVKLRMLRSSRTQTSPNMQQAA